ncbi:nickel/cobalt transporter [Breoghania sp. L-A4]|uniref:nickel/cobalt transporter n=1 Tax=Breoghania sp. L-A4 TaxID=2304600 RepID=UPI0020BF36D7|nr:nickel/cobalt transporter [Breoghania sp. L-A4]
MTPHDFRVAVAGVVVLALAIIVCAADPAVAARSPLGVGLPDASSSMGAGGPLAGFFAYVAAKQAAFYRELTATLALLKTDGRAFWLLGGLSFAYGVFHAAGPGHGKAVISSYILASEETVKKAVVLSFAAAMAQGVTAVVLIGIAAIILNMTSIAITRTTEIFEIGSYAMITALGAWLVWGKVLRPIWARASVLQFVPAAAGHAHGHDHVHANGHNHEHAHDHGPGEVCSSCGHSHAPDPTMLQGEMTLAKAWSVVLAVGLRPCSGALIVLVFALSQGLLAAGIAATFAMALGTGLTVAALASLAVGAKGLAMRFAGEGSGLAVTVHRTIEILGAVVVLLLGLILLIAALGWD